MNRFGFGLLLMVGLTVLAGCVSPVSTNTGGSQDPPTIVYELSGVVRDVQDGLIANATVSVEGETAVAYTDGSGHFSLALPGPGEYVVRAATDGRTSLSTRATLLESTPSAKDLVVWVYRTPPDPPDPSKTFQVIVRNRSKLQTEVSIQGNKCTIPVGLSCTWNLPPGTYTAILNAGMGNRLTSLPLSYEAQQMKLVDHPAGDVMLIHEAR